MFKLNVPSVAAVTPIMARDLQQGQLFVVDSETSLSDRNVKMAVLLDGEEDVRYIYPFMSSSLSSDITELDYIREDKKVYPVVATVSELKLDTDQ